MRKKLYLIPNAIHPEAFFTIPSYVNDTVGGIRYFFVENERNARRFLKKIQPALSLEECKFFTLNEHSFLKDIKDALKEVSAYDIAIISEAGCPCVADPGGELVRLAHQENRDVIPLSGPSSIFLALMASGLNGQNFVFNGYLPKEKNKRIEKIKNLEKRSFIENQTQIFMETPYRNQSIFEDILFACSSQTLLCVASDLTGPEQYIKTLTIDEWKKITLNIHNKPSLFLIQKVR